MIVPTHTLSSVFPEAFVGTRNGTEIDIPEIHAETKVLSIRLYRCHFSAVLMRGFSVQRHPDHHRPLGSILVIDDSNKVLQRFKVDDGKLANSMPPPYPPVWAIPERQPPPPNLPPLPMINSRYTAGANDPPPDPVIAPRFTSALIYSSRVGGPPDFEDSPYLGGAE
jgi:hypothetical protein